MSERARENVEHRSTVGMNTIETLTKMPYCAKTRDETAVKTHDFRGQKICGGKNGRIGKVRETFSQVMFSFESRRHSLLFLTLMNKSLCIFFSSENDETISQIDLISSLPENSDGKM